MMLSAITFPSLGIEVDPSPVAFTVAGKEIYWYGIIIAFGFVLAAALMIRKAPRFGLNMDNVLDMMLWGVPIGIVGARAYYCIFYWELFRSDPISCLYIWEGGLAIYGGVIGGVIGLAIFRAIKKIPFPPILDVATFGVIIGQICGRWGNFMNREAHGGETDFFLRMGLTGADGSVRYYHPTFLYESLWNVVGLVLMHIVSKRRKFDGQIACIYFLWYGLGRAWIEGLRTDSLYLFGTGIRVSQLLSVLLVLAAGAVLVYALYVKKANGEKLYVNRETAEEQPAEENLQ